MATNPWRTTQRLLAPPDVYTLRYKAVREVEATAVTCKDTSRLGVIIHVQSNTPTLAMTIWIFVKGDHATAKTAIIYNFG